MSTSSGCPLDREKWQKFGRDELSGAERKSLLGHLGDDCSECDEFIAGLDEGEFHDTLSFVAQGLSQIVSERYEPDRLERAQMFEKISCAPVKKSWLPEFFPSWAPAAISLAVITLVAVVVMNTVLPQKPDGIKGVDKTPQSILLQVAVLKRSANGPLERGMRGEKYNEMDILFFRYEINSPGYVYLLRVNGSSSEIIHPSDPANPEVQGEGVYEFRDGGKAEGFHLKGLDGRQVFIAIKSDAPMNPEKEIRPLIENYMKNGGLHSSVQPPSKPSDAWALDTFEITVGGQ